ncbi:MAG: hypothetical protein ACYC61_08405, partial [Isosphaeraceae bacterium]
MSQIHPDARAPDDPDARPDGFEPPSSPNPARPRERPSGEPEPSLPRAIILLGLLLAGSRLAAGMQDRPATAASMIRSAIDATAIALAGWIVSRATELARRTLADAVKARGDRNSRLNAARLNQMDRALAAIERLAVAFETRGSPGPLTPVEDRRDQARLIAELATALREVRLDEAKALLDRLDAEFPDEPTRQDLRDQLEAARRHQSEERIAQIDAARRVNDADRVLELYT